MAPAAKVAEDGLVMQPGVAHVGRLVEGGTKRGHGSGGRGRTTGKQVAQGH